VPNNGTPPGATYNVVLSGVTTGAVIIDSPIVIEQLTLQGGSITDQSSAGNNSLKLNALSTFAGGILQGVSVNANAGANITAGVYVSPLSSSTTQQLTLAGGTSTWSGGDITLAQGARLVNAAGSTLLITGDNNIVVQGSTGGTGVINAGLIRKQGGTGITYLGAGLKALITNTGTIEMLTGTVDLTTSLGSSQNSGTVTVGRGASVVGVYGGILQGNGTLAGVNVCNILSPGISGPGVLTAAGPLRLGIAASGGAYAVDLDGTAAGTGYDQLSLGTTGSINLNGAALSTALGYAPSPADALAIILGIGTGTQVTGTFANAPDGSVISVGSYGGMAYAAQIHYTPNSVSLDHFQAVPEPGGLALSLIAVAGACGRRFLKRREAAGAVRGAAGEVRRCSQ
jgi:hypothetical protein